MKLLSIAAALTLFAALAPAHTAAAGASYDPRGWDGANPWSSDWGQGDDQKDDKKDKDTGKDDKDKKDFDGDHEVNLNDWWDQGDWSADDDKDYGNKTHKNSHKGDHADDWFEGWDEGQHDWGDSPYKKDGKKSGDKQHKSKKSGEDIPRFTGVPTPTAALTGLVMFGVIVGRPRRERPR